MVEQAVHTNGATRPLDAPESEVEKGSKMSFPFAGARQISLFQTPRVMTGAVKSAKRNRPGKKPFSPRTYKGGRR